MRLLRRLSTPWHVLLKELSAFGVVGAINFVVDLSIFNALHFGAGIGILTSKVISTAVSTTLAYFMNRHWSFSHRARSGLRREYALFFGLNVIALFIGLAILGFTHYILGYTDELSINIANIIGIGLGTIFRFWSYKRWVFVSDAKAAATREPAKIN
jgi:putative flippase GtrA